MKRKGFLKEEDIEVQKETKEGQELDKNTETIQGSADNLKEIEDSQIGEETLTLILVSKSMKPAEIDMIAIQTEETTILLHMIILKIITGIEIGTWTPALDLIKIETKMQANI